MENIESLYSLEAEQSVLGSLMLEGDAWDAVADILKPEHFVNREHRDIFCAIAQLAGANRDRDALTVNAVLEGLDQAQRVGGLPMLGGMVKNTPSAANVASYAMIIRDRAILRSLLKAMKNGEAIISDAGIPLAGKPDAIMDGIMAAVGTGGSGSAKTAKQAGREWLEAMDHIHSRGNAITGQLTGFPDIDKHIRGLNNKNLILIAARPSMGKTTLMVNMIRAVLNNGGSAFLATMEMSSDDTMNQLSACHSGASYEGIQTAQLDDDRIQSANNNLATGLSKWHFTIDDRGTQTLATIRRGVQTHIRMFGSKPVVFVDYVQLVTGPGDNETNRIGAISRGLKTMAQDLDIPLVLLSQLNRDLEKRNDRRPMLSDLRSSGDLEQDADVVMFIYDDSVYNESNTSGLSELIIAKNRRGKRGFAIPLVKDFGCARFLSASHQDLPENWRRVDEGRKNRGDL